MIENPDTLKVLPLTNVIKTIDRKARLYKVTVSLPFQWSFGVVLWELVTRGKTPYTGMKPEYIKEYVESGQRLVKPANSPDQM